MTEETKLERKNYRLDAVQLQCWIEARKRDRSNALFDLKRGQGDRHHEIGAWIAFATALKFDMNTATLCTPVYMGLYPAFKAVPVDDPEESLGRFVRRMTPKCPLIEGDGGGLFGY